MIVCNMVDPETGKHHPLVLREAPFAGRNQPKGCRRFRSSGHHSEGFDSREASVETCREWAGSYGWRFVDADVENPASKQGITVVLPAGEVDND